MTKKDLTKMSTEDLVDSLIENNTLASEFDKLGLWSKFNSWDWIDLLSAQPRFTNKCDKWKEFDSNEWTALLENQPHFADKCDKWQEFDVDDLCKLLSSQPELLDKYSNKTIR